MNTYSVLEWSIDPPWPHFLELHFLHGKSNSGHHPLQRAHIVKCSLTLHCTMPTKKDKKDFQYKQDDVKIS